MGDDEKAAPPRRKPYVRPELRKVHLRPDEAVLGGCKTGAIAGPGNSPCTSPSACFTTTS